MKRKHLRNALAALLLIGTGGQAYGQTNVDGLLYTVDSETLTATLTDFETVADDSIVNIPEHIAVDGQTYTVDKIGEWAFNGFEFLPPYREKILKVKAIIIPKTVKSIGAYAFDIPLYKGDPSSYRGDGNLESITFAEGSQLESIGEQAFGGRAIFELDLPEGLKTIGKRAFYQSENLRRVGLPSTLESIAPEAFYRTDNLRNITLPDGLRVIADKAFAESQIAEVTLPASLQSIGASAFNSSAMKVVKPLGATPPVIQTCTFPWGVAVIPPLEFLDAYFEADVWKDMNVKAGSFTDDEGRSFDIIGSKEVRLTDFGRGGIWQAINITIPESETVEYDGRTFQVAEYAPEAFEYVDTLRVERSYTALPAWRFRYLKDLYLPASIEDLSAVSFSNCYDVEIHLSSPQPPTISNISGIGTLYLDESFVPAYAGSIWSQVAKLNPFWEDVIRYSRLFDNKQNVMVTDSRWTEHLVIPATVSHEGVEYTVTLVKNIGNARAVTIVSAETVLAEGAFYEKVWMETVELPEGMTTLPNNLFTNSGIKNVRLPSTLKVIGDAAFSRTTKLRHIDLPEGLEEIRSSAFFGSGLKSLHLPTSVTNIWEAALNAEMLKEFTVAEANPHFCAKDGMLFSKDMKTLIAYPCGQMEKHYDMPNSVESVANAAFSKSKLSSVRLSENYAGIAENAVINGSSPAFSQPILNVYIPRPDINLENLNSYNIIIYLPASYRNNDNEQVKEQIRQLSSQHTVRFEGDESLPFEYKFITTLQGEVYAFITAARSVGLPHHLEIPAEAIVPKQESENFPSSYFNEEDQCYHIPVAGIDDNAFALCDSLVSVTFPAGLRVVGEAAFFGCKNLESVQGLSKMSMEGISYN